MLPATLPVGQSEHVYLNLPESTAAASFLPKGRDFSTTLRNHTGIYSLNSSAETRGTLKERTLDNANRIKKIN